MNFNDFLIFFSLDAPKSQCSSLSEGDGESFECYGENEILDGGGVDLELTPHVSSNQIGWEEKVLQFNEFIEVQSMAKK